mmetsp:Transcript_21893/g.55669  ORF Transcript_21893/g.55669 Transcript_21893/m.55669 type:complete len:289 (-) Transcript_21893:45-911(-)
MGNSGCVGPSDPEARSAAVEASARLRGGQASRGAAPSVAAWSWMGGGRSSRSSTCGGAIVSSGGQRVTVLLNIYDIGTYGVFKYGVCKLVNTALQPTGMGAFHCGVELFGHEWSYSYIEPRAGYLGAPSRDSGIFACKPRHCPGHSFVDSIPMGSADVDSGDLQSILMGLEMGWPAVRYDMLTKNCCHFCQDLCAQLGLGALPTRVTGLASACASLAAGEVSLMDCRSTIGSTNGGCSSICCGSQTLDPELPEFREPVPAFSKEGFAGQLGRSRSLRSSSQFVSPLEI